MKRNTNDCLIFGVCSGFADELGVSPVLVRLAFVVLTLMGFGFPILVYLIAALLMPAE